MYTGHSHTRITAYCSGTAPCEHVSVSGGIPVPAAGKWRPHDMSNGRNIWKLSVPKDVARAGAHAQSALHWLNGNPQAHVGWPGGKPHTHVGWLGGNLDDETAVLTRARWSVFFQYFFSIFSELAMWATCYPFFKSK